MKVLTRYLLRAHVGPLLFAFLALTGVILINTLAKELANLAGKGLPMSVVLEFFVLSLPANIALTLPMSVLVAVLYTFSTLATENEIAALRASGIDLRRAAMPVVLLAAVIAVSMVWFNDQVLPASNYRWRILMTDVAQTRPLLALRERAINPIRTSDGMTPYYLEADRIDVESGLLWDVSIYDVSNDNVSRTIQADSGQMRFNSNYTDLLLTLFDGDMHEVDFGDPSSFQEMEFNEQVMRMAGVSDRLERSGVSTYRTDRDMTVAMMQERIDTLTTELASVRVSLSEAEMVRDSIAALDSVQAAAEGRLEAVDSGGVDGFPAGPPASEAEILAGLLGDSGQTRVAAPSAGGRATPRAGPDSEVEALRYATARIENLEYQIREYQVEIQKKFSIAAATLVFVLIGIPIALRFPGGGIGMVLIVSLGIFGIYYVGLIGGETLGDEGYVPPLVAMWLTNGIFGILGLLGFWRLGREQRTSRGGTFGEWRWLSRLGIRKRAAESG